MSSPIEGQVCYHQWALPPSSVMSPPIRSGWHAIHPNPRTDRRYASCGRRSNVMLVEVHKSEQSYVNNLELLVAEFIIHANHHMTTFTLHNNRDNQTQTHPKQHTTTHTKRKQTNPPQGSVSPVTGNTASSSQAALSASSLSC